MENVEDLLDSASSLATNEYHYEVKRWSKSLQRAPRPTLPIGPNISQWDLTHFRQDHCQLS
ncbi:hypothetical protein HGRIS_010750 [Hohenbuehelia grisea]|uniref:Uncharacterized protein n=1 Tax=Hohenbuehelia grisea TaxID=104357 RepID=A0ABR3IY50_9AGAR